jgi:hypothetical protein
MPKRGSPEWIKTMQRAVCPGCRQNRYNQGRGYRETENDAPVTCEYCWNLLDSVYYDRTDACYYCRCHDKVFPSEKARRAARQRERQRTGTYDPYR